MSEFAQTLNQTDHIVSAIDHDSRNHMARGFFNILSQFVGEIRQTLNGCFQRARRGIGFVFAVLSASVVTNLLDEFFHPLELFAFIGGLLF